MMQLDIWGMWTTPSLPLLQNTLKLGVVLLAMLLFMGQIDPFINPLALWLEYLLVVRETKGSIPGRIIPKTQK